MARPIRAALRDAWRGLRSVLAHERNLRIELALAAGWLVVLALLRPAAVWWALSVVQIALVLGLELVNTALERLADRVHPDQHPLIGQAKDCAAAAVLVAALASLALAALVLANA